MIINKLVINATKEIMLINLKLSIPKFFNIISSFFSIKLINKNCVDISILDSTEEEWTPELEAKIDEALELFEKEYMKEDGTYDLERLNEEITNEGFFGSIIGGLTGFALGKSVGKMVAKVLFKHKM